MQTVCSNSLSKEVIRGETFFQKGLSPDYSSPETFITVVLQSNHGLTLGATVGSTRSATPFGKDF